MPHLLEPAALRCRSFQSPSVHSPVTISCRVPSMPRPPSTPVVVVRPGLCSPTSPCKESRRPACAVGLSLVECTAYGAAAGRAYPQGESSAPRQGSHRQIDRGGLPIFRRAAAPGTVGTLPEAGDSPPCPRTALAWRANRPGGHAARERAWGGAYRTRHAPHAAEHAACMGSVFGSTFPA
jgi:hypothetical protein